MVRKSNFGLSGLLAFCFLLFPPDAPAQSQNQSTEDEIVASLAGGRVIVLASNDKVIFGAIDSPIEAGAVPPRVVDLDSRHVGVLFGASEWRTPADPKPARLD